MAFLTAQKKYETIARKKVKPSMEEEINAEKLEELLGMNITKLQELFSRLYKDTKNSKISLQSLV